VVGLKDIRKATKLIDFISNQSIHIFNGPIVIGARLLHRGTNSLWGIKSVALSLISLMVKLRHVAILFFKIFQCLFFGFVESSVKDAQFNTELRSILWRQTGLDERFRLLHFTR
jgi:hypothetical protein